MQQKIITKENFEAVNHFVPRYGGAGTMGLMQFLCDLATNMSHLRRSKQFCVLLLQTYRAYGPHHYIQSIISHGGLFVGKRCLFVFEPRSGGLFIERRYLNDL